MEAAAALAVLKGEKSSAVLIDFDETLFLRNSTEAYLDLVLPGALGFLVLQLLERLAPWRLLRSDKRQEARDWFRVFTCTVLFPWTYLRWRFHARRLMETYLNRPLHTGLILRGSEVRNIVVTMGFRFIVWPLLKSIGWRREALVACRMWPGPRDRLLGKVGLVERALGAELMTDALALTDSPNDAELLAKVRVPLLVTWPDAKYVPALSQAYVPFLYLEKGKRPGERYFARVILYDEGVTFFLAYSWLSRSPFLHQLGLSLFLFSFWCIYELGYVENDRAALTHEKKPKLSATYAKYIDRVRSASAWLWSAAFAFPGAACLQWVKSGTVTPLGLVTLLLPWALVLLGVRLTYWMYNHLDVGSRVWVYPVLQAFRCFGLLAVAWTQLAGALFLAAVVISRWFPYAIYRAGGERKEFPEQLVRAALFAGLLAVCQAAAHGDADLVSAQTAVMLGWLVLRARHQLRLLFAGMTLKTR